MSLAPGDTVTIINLKKTGIIAEVKGRGRYAVTLGKVSMICYEKDLRRIETKKKPAKPSVPAGTYTKKPRKKDRLFRAELDLHGKNVSEAVEMTAQFISDAIVAGHSEVKIIHGIGSGKLKVAVHQYLQSESAVKSFALESLNPGTTRVRL